MSDTTLTDLLHFDSLAEAEKITGTSYKSSKDTTWLGLGLMQQNSKAKDAILTERDDTMFRNKLDRYQRIIGEEGFEKVLELPFTVPSEWADEPIRAETFFIYYHPDGMLLVFDTYNTDSLNGGKLYFQLQTTNPEVRYTLRCSISPVSDGVFFGDIDCREALRFNISRLREAGNLMNPWSKPSFIWLLHHGDTKVEDYDHQAINNSRVAMLPEHVQLMMGYLGDPQ